MANTSSNDREAAESRGQVAEANYLQPDTAVADYRAAAAQEYGQFVAIEPIDFDGARAYNVGDPVPAENVKRYEYVARGLVAKRSSKAAQDVPASPAPGA